MRQEGSGIRSTAKVFPLRRLLRLIWRSLRARPEAELDEQEKKRLALRENRTPGGSSHMTRQMATTQVTTTPLMLVVGSHLLFHRQSFIPQVAEADHA